MYDDDEYDDDDDNDGPEDEDDVDHDDGGFLVKYFGTCMRGRCQQKL